MDVVELEKHLIADLKELYTRTGEEIRLSTDIDVNSISELCDY